MKKILVLLLGLCLSFSVGAQVTEFKESVKKQLVADLQKDDAGKTSQASYLNRDWQRAIHPETQERFREPSSPIYAKHLPSDFYSATSIPASTFYPSGHSTLGSYGNPVNIRMSSFGTYGQNNYLNRAVNQAYHSGYQDNFR